MTLGQCGCYNVGIITIYQEEICMAVNLIVLIVFLALTVGAGYLTWRAIRARRLWVKIAGGLGAGLLTLLLGAITLVGMNGFRILFMPSVPTAREIKLAGTPDQIARGEYLVSLACVECHGAVDASGNPTRNLPLSGGWNVAEAEGFGFMGQMSAENLTPGGKLAGYTDGEIFRALRHGVSKEGKLLGFMALLPYANLSDADTEAIVAYLRSLSPTPNTAPTGDQYSFIGTVMFGAGMLPLPGPAAEKVSAPAQGKTAEYGKYVATYGDCLGCHGPDAMGTEASAFGPAIPSPRPLVSVLTQDQFFEMMRTGIRPGGTPFPATMPWEIASKLTDDDLAALYAYLKQPMK